MCHVAGNEAGSALEPLAAKVHLNLESGHVDKASQKNVSDKWKHFHARFPNKFPVRLCAKISCQSWPALVSKPRPVSYSSVGQD